MRNKHDVFECFKEFKNLGEKQTLRYIKILRSDQGGEYTSRAFIDIAEKMEFYKSIQGLILNKRGGR